VEASETLGREMAVAWRGEAGEGIGTASLVLLLLAVVVTWARLDIRLEKIWVGAPLLVRERPRRSSRRPPDFEGLASAASLISKAGSSSSIMLDLDVFLCE
jgi:hypothetical protein